MGYDFLVKQNIALPFIFLANIHMGFYWLKFSAVYNGIPLKNWAVKQGVLSAKMIPQAAFYKHRCHTNNLSKS